MMDIQIRGGLGGMSTSHSLCSLRTRIFCCYQIHSPLPALYSTRNSKSQPQEPKRNGNRKGDDDKFSTDWDKAWSRFLRKKNNLFSQFSPNKYVSWNPRRSNYPLSEEIDPIKRTERSNLMLWTSPRFTLAGAIVLVSFLVVYTILAPVNW